MSYMPFCDIMRMCCHVVKSCDSALAPLVHAALVLYWIDHEYYESAMLEERKAPRHR